MTGIPTIDVWCGICKDTFAADSDWAIRYIEKMKRELSRKIGKIRHGISQSKFDDLIADLTRDFTEAGLL